MRLRARTDAGHKAIVQALRKVGCGVLDLSRAGHGCPDLLVKTHIPMTRLILMEVKEPNGKLTPDQKNFIDEWPEVVVVRSVTEALEAVGVI